MPEFKNYYSREISLNINKTDGLIDEDTRSIKTVAATENEAIVFDWERWEPIREILLMEGCDIPQNRKVPLLNCHQRSSDADIRGSFKDIEIKNNELNGRSYFAETKDGENSWILAKGGHLDSVSIGYRVYDDYTVKVQKGDSVKIGGRTFTNEKDGVLVIRTKWSLLELSLVPIGADEAAKFRNLIMSNDVKLKQERGHMPQEKNDGVVDNKTTHTENTEGRASVPEANKESIRMQNEAHQKEVDEARQAGEKAQAERVRTNESMLQLAGLPEEATKELRESYLKDSIYGSDFGNLIAEKKRSIMEQENNTTLTNVGNVQLKADQKDKFREVATDAIVLGLGHNLPEKREKAVRESQFDGGVHSTLRELLLNANESAVDVMRMSNNPSKLVERAFSIVQSDISDFFIDAANKIVGISFTNFSTDYEAWTVARDVKDFKTVHEISSSHISDWDEMLDGQPFTQGKMESKSEKGALGTFGKYITIPRQAFINDDLNMLNALAVNMGQSGKRKVNNKVYTYWTDSSLVGPTMYEDGVAFFNAANHVNLIATSGLLSHSTLVTADKALKDIKRLAPDSQSETERVGMGAKILLTGTNNEINYERILSSEYETDVSNNLNNKTRNVWRSRLTKRIYSSKLQDKLDAASKSNAWYVMSQEPLTVLYLQGKRTPTIESAQNAIGHALGMAMQGYFDFGVFARDWRTAVYNDGES